MAITNYFKCNKCEFQKRISSRRYSSEQISTLQKSVESRALELDAAQLQVLQKLEDLNKELERYSSPDGVMRLFAPKKAPKGLYIHGSVGCGKTMLMDLFYECCFVKLKKRTHFIEFMSEVHSRIHNAKLISRQVKKPRAEEQLWDPIVPVANILSSKAWLLCFDEFQVVDIADAMILKRLFTLLFDLGVVMVATSNTPPDELYKNGANRSIFLPFISILKEHCSIVSLTSNMDYRVQGFQSEESSRTHKRFFIKTETNMQWELNSVFNRLCANENKFMVGPKTIMVKGRNITFGKTCGGLLDVEFSELCNGFLGAEDFLKIAQTFHTLVVRNVPKMNLNNGSQTKRFILLIDTLYDNGIRLVLSCDVKLPTLFSEVRAAQVNTVPKRALRDDLHLQNNTDLNITTTEEAYAFDRTTSRLLEMQTDKYWDKGK